MGRYKEFRNGIIKSLKTQLFTKAFNDTHLMWLLAKSIEKLQKSRIVKYYEF